MSHRISPLFSAALLLPAVASHAASDDSTQMLEPVVVTASRTAQPLKAVIGDVTVIGRKALERFSGEAYSVPYRVNLAYKWRPMVVLAKPVRCFCVVPTHHIHWY